MNELFTYGVNTIIMRNHIRWNHTTLQLKLKKQFIYNYCATIPLEIWCINK
jgi:hypothetical protein